jgi:hypothetical protein
MLGYAMAVLSSSQCVASELEPEPHSAFSFIRVCNYNKCLSSEDFAFLKSELYAYNLERNCRGCSGIRCFPLFYLFFLFYY